MSGGGEGAQALARTLHSPVSPAKAGIQRPWPGRMLGGHRATSADDCRRLDSDALSWSDERIRTSEFALAAGAKALREDILAPALPVSSLQHKENI